MIKKYYARTVLLFLFSFISNISDGQITAGDDVLFVLGSPCNVLGNDTLNGMPATTSNVIISN